MNGINVILVLTLAAIGGYAVCAWLSPAHLERMAVRLQARARGLVAARAAYAEAHKAAMGEGKKAAKFEPITVTGALSAEELAKEFVAQASLCAGEAAQ